MIKTYRVSVDGVDNSLIIGNVFLVRCDSRKVVALLRLADPNIASIPLQGERYHIDFFLPRDFGDMVEHIKLVRGQ